MKEEFERILNNHGIYGEDVEQVLYAVHDMLAFMADKTYEEEPCSPYAHELVKKYNSTAYTVFCLRDVLYNN